MTPIEQYNNTVMNKACDALTKRGFEAYLCKNKAEALEKALAIIEKGSSVSWGGTMSAKEIGLMNAISDGDYNLIDRSKATTLEEKTELTRQAFFANWYIGSANALSLDGKIINIDGTGNRVAAMIYGPDNVLLIVGINKLALNEEEALTRAKNVASPINAVRLGCDTPCTNAGICVDCLKDDCICSYITVTRKCKPKGRIKVILVGEELGF